MANELTIQVQSLLKYTGVSDQYASGSKVVSQLTQYFIKGIQNIGFASHVAVDVGSEIILSNIGYCLFVNLDATNYVEVGVDLAAVFYPIIRVKPGEFAFLRWNSAITSLPYAKANIAAVDLFYTIYAK